MPERNQFERLHRQLNQLTRYLDVLSLRMQNAMEDFILAQGQLIGSPVWTHQSNSKNKEQSKGVNQLQSVFQYLLEDRVNKVHQDIDSIIKGKVVKDLQHVMTMYDSLSKESLEVYKSFNQGTIEGTFMEANTNQLDFNNRIELSKSEKQLYFGNLITLLNDNFSLSGHMDGFDNSDDFKGTLHMQNMQVMDKSRIKSKDANSIKSQEGKLLDEIVEQRNSLMSDSTLLQYISRIRQEREKKKLPDAQCLKVNGLLESYRRLFALNSHSCIYNKIMHPFIYPINPQSNSLLDQQVVLNKHPQRAFSSCEPKYQHKQTMIEFKIEAQGFGAVQAPHLSADSIKSKIVSHIQKFSHPLRKSKEEDGFASALTPLESQIMTYYQSLKQSPQIPCFQFGLIDPSSSNKLDFSKPQIFPDREEEQQIDKFPIKILNISNKFYIQSLYQAKLIRLNPDWDYFRLVIVQSIQTQQRNPFVPRIELYGLIQQSKIKEQKAQISQSKSQSIKKIPDSPQMQMEKTQNSQQLLDQTSIMPFKEEIILQYPLSQGLSKKILKPYFAFKGFQCKITVNDNKTTLQH